MSEIIQLISPPDRDAQTDFPTIAFRSAVPDPVVAHADVAADRSQRGEKAGVAKTLVELRADFQHLRLWRRSVEQAQSYTFKAVITAMATGFVGAVWLGIKATLGR